MNRNGKTNGMLSLLVVFTLAGGSVAFAMNEQSGMKEHSDPSSHELLLNANTLIGNTVIDKSGKEMGTIKDLLIDQETGQIAYIILAYGGTFGGTLGINQENYSIAWKDVVLTKKDDGMVVEVAETAIGETSSKTATTSGRHDRDIFRSGKPETVEGIVENIDHEMFEEGVGMTDSLVVLDIQSAKGKERVRIAPDDYLKKQGIEIKEGDKVEVSAIRVTRDGENLLVASTMTLKKNGKVLKLRLDDGTPKWEQGINTKSQSKN
ncbi:MAG: PRC-barrel domain-containing protein [Nitrospirales bacterium]